MKRLLIILLLMSAMASGARDVYDMNSGWRFFDAAATTSDGAQSVVLPHIYSGVGNYLKELDVPAAWRGKKVTLRGGGGGAVLTVFVNGRLAGEHRGAYNGWSFDISMLLRSGAKNAIHIICAPAAPFDVLPTAGDMELSGGLFRDVELVVGNGLEPLVRTTSVTRDIVEGVVETDEQADVTVLDPAGRVAARASGKGTIKFTVNDPQLWHGRQAPNLYNIKVRSAGDSVTLSTGFRTVGMNAAGGFMLNGESYPLRGVVVTQDRPLIGAAIGMMQAAEDVELIKEMGANAVRVLGVVHNPAFYDLCDQEGIVVWSDFPLMGEAFFTDKAFVPVDTWRENAKMQAQEIIAQQRMHPCVVMWGLFSNMQNRGDDPTPFIKELNELAHSEDPTRLTAASSNADGQMNFVPDLICWNHSFGWTSGLPTEFNMWRDSFMKQWGGRLRSAVSYGAGGSPLHAEASPMRPDPLGDRHPEAWQTWVHEQYLEFLHGDPRFWGVFVCNMFDYAAPRAVGGERGVNDFGLVTLDRKVRKDAYYLYKANWDTDESFVYIAERRRTVRGSEPQSFKVYTNMGRVELFVNGVSAGVQNARGGICRWTDVRLRRGSNNIEVRAGEQRDAVRFEVSDRPYRTI